MKDLIYIKGFAQGKELYNTLRAIHLSTILHYGQTRKTGEPYVSHPARVAAELLALHLNTDEILTTALLHDVLEDCDVSTNDLILQYNISTNIVDNIAILTKTNINTETYYNNIKKEPICCLVKMADRCHNLSTMIDGFTTEKILSYVDETEKYVIPLCKYVKNFYPEYADQAFTMKYHMESICKLAKGILKTHP